VAERSFAHTGTAVTEFAEWLSELAGDPGCVAIAIEIPRGAVVETLVERGVHVYAINPKQLDRFRDRHNVSGAKDDRRDAFVLADSVRTDRPCFRRVRLEAPLVIQLRELSRIDEDLRREANQLTNRLREQLQRFYAQMLKLCPAADEPWLWALLELAPSPASRGGCGPSVLKSCSRNTAFAACGRRSWERCCRPPRCTSRPGWSRLPPNTLRCCCRVCAWSTPSASAAGRASKLCSKNSRARTTEMKSRPDTAMSRFFPPCPGSEKSWPPRSSPRPPVLSPSVITMALRAHAGIAPITKQSGKHKMVLMRYACNGRLRHALYHWARVAVMCDPPSKNYYAALR